MSNKGQTPIARPSARARARARVEAARAFSSEVKAEGWTDEATKAMVRVETSDSTGLIEREVVCNESIELVPGEDYVCGVTYSAEVVGVPVLADGSTYAAGKPFTVISPVDAAVSESNVTRATGLEFDAARKDVIVMTSETQGSVTEIIIEMALAPKFGGGGRCCGIVED